MNAPPAIGRLLVGTKLLAELLDCSDAMVRKMRDNAELPEPVRLGTLVRWRVSDIELWLDLGRPGRKRFTEMKRERGE